MRRVLVLVLVLMMLVSCTANVGTDVENNGVNENQINELGHKDKISDEKGSVAAEQKDITSQGAKRRDILMQRYDKVSDHFEIMKPITIKQGQYEMDWLETYTFKQTDTFKGAETEATTVLENGMNPGLGIQGLHERGITGAGVRVAIIDQPLLQHHPEYDGKIESYFDFDDVEDKIKFAGRGSMHGPGVTSLLVGENIGVAPDVKVHYASAPSWKADARYFAKALNWIIDENEALSDTDKIRVVSVSAAPSSKDIFKNGEQWTEAVARANENGILVIDGQPNTQSGFVGPGYVAIEDRDNFEQFEIGYLNNMEERFYKKSLLYAPCSKRTVAEEYEKGVYDYRYCGVGGLSWSIPYAAGVFALGCQVNPELDYETLKQMMFDSAFITEDGYKVINPPAFIEAVEKTLED